MPSRAPHDHRLVFVGGLHRSGTTPLARSLGRHPQVSAFEGTGATEDEGQHLQSVYPAARTYGGTGRFALDPRAHLTESSPLATPDNAERLFAQWSTHWDLERPVLLEKSPPNLVMTRFLQALYPGARIVVIVRHPVVVALASQKWTGLRAFDRLVEHWVRAHEIFLADAPCLDHVHVVKYEELVVDPAAVMAAVGTFLGLDPLPTGEGLAPGRSDAYDARWRDMHRSRNPFVRRAVRRVRERHGAAIARFGYDVDDLAVSRPFPLPAPDPSPISGEAT